jgi:hypothetical protein
LLRVRLDLDILNRIGCLPSDGVVHFFSSSRWQAVSWTWIGIVVTARRVLLALIYAVLVKFGLQRRQLFKVVGVACFFLVSSLVFDQLLKEQPFRWRGSVCRIDRVYLVLLLLDIECFTLLTFIILYILLDHSFVSIFLRFKILE